MQAPSSNQSRGESGRVPGVTYWRVEGSLFEISALRSVGFFNWNSQSFLERILRPMTEYFGAEGFIANRLEFREGETTGRLCEPVIRPRGPFAWLASGSVDGRVPREKLLSQLGWKENPQLLDTAVQPALRSQLPARTSVERLSNTPQVPHLSVRDSLSGKHLLLIGVTGFIGKVWLVDLLEKIPNIAKITLLIRRNRTTSAQRRFEKIVEESPTLDRLQEIHGANLAAFLREKVEVVEGDVSQLGLGLQTATQSRLQRSLDVIANSAG